MRRFYVPPTQVQTPLIYVTGTEAHHLLHVLRLGVGAEVEIFDGTGKSYGVRIIRCTEKEVCCHILTEQSALLAHDTIFVLAQGVPRGEKMRWIIEKTTELGIDMIIPLQTERTVPRGDASRIAHWQERWQRIAREATKQCQRVQVPVIWPCTPWEQFLRITLQALKSERPPMHGIALASDPLVGKTGDILKLLCWEGNAPLLRTVLPTCLPTQGVVFMVGPEGGFTAQEVQQAQAHGFLPVSLGKRVLRTETVSLAMLTLLQYHYGDLG
jgi:16S rRNA (uracil1498-N3)-methyltransferase